MKYTSIKPITGTSAKQKNPQANSNGRLQLFLYHHNTAVMVKVAVSGSHHSGLPGLIVHCGYTNIRFKGNSAL